MKQYQIAILAFAVGIFSVTFSFVYFINKREDIILEPKKEREYLSVIVFFSNLTEDPQTLYCDKTYPVERAVTRLSDNKNSELGEVAYLALTELINGPAGFEKDNGYFTSINAETKIQNIIIEGGVATVDFNQAFNDGVGGSCRVQAIRSQITETLKQFSEIKEVVISVNGDSENTLQP